MRNVNILYTLGYAIIISAAFLESKPLEITAAIAEGVMWFIVIIGIIIAAATRKIYKKDTLHGLQKWEIELVSRHRNFQYMMRENYFMYLMIIQTMVMGAYIFIDDLSMYFLVFIQIFLRLAYSILFFKSLKGTK